MQNPFSESKNDFSDIIISRADDAISTELEGETVILNIETGIYSGLDKVGTSIWNFIEKPISFSDLSGKILEEYEVEKEQCIADLQLFLKDMFANRLIKTSADGAV